MNISDVNTGVTYYFPVTVKEKKEDKFSTCIVDTDGGEWDEFDVGQLVTRGEIISGATDEKLKSADDQVDFWKRDSESAHEEIRKLQKLLNSKEEGVRKIEEYADQLKKIADDLGDENEKLKAENEQEKKRVQIEKDSFENLNQQFHEYEADIESAHEENRRLQEQVKRLEDSNSQYAEQIRRYDNALKDTENKVAVKIEQLAKSEKRCAYLQTQLESFHNINNEVERYKGLSESLQKRVDKLVADKARPVCVAVNDVETPKVKALSKALREQGQVIRQKNATINALAERVVYLEGEMKKNNG